MNKFSKIAASTLLTLTLLAPALAAADEMKAKVDYSKVEVMMKDNMDLVPLRQLAEAYGFQVKWNNDDRSVTLTLSTMMDDKSMTDKSMTDKKMDDTMTDKDMKDKDMKDKPMADMAYTITIKIDDAKFMVGMSDKMLSHAPVIINNKTYVTKDFVETYLAAQMMMK
jgi:hypothetical protein